MILVVGQNSAWQNTYLLPDMLPGKVNRVTGVTRSAAGKGANLSRGLNFLGKTPHLLAYAGGHIGGQFSLGALPVLTEALVRIHTGSSADWTFSS